MNAALEPVNDVVEKVVAKNGPIDPAVEYLGKYEGRWLGVPMTRGTLLLGCCTRFDMMKEHGGVDVQAINPCARCVVPSRDARTGEAIAGFQKRFAELRQRHLPAGTSTGPFNHYYRFTVNTRIAATEAGKVSRLGDAIS
jgi:hypothetical protein